MQPSESCFFKIMTLYINSLFTHFLNDVDLSVGAVD